MSENNKIVLSEEDIAKYTECFNEIDSDKDGHISMKELYFAMRALNRDLTERQLQKTHLEMNGNVPDAVNLTEFLKLMADTKRYEISSDQVYEELYHSFKVFDEEGTGQIRATDLERIMTTLGHCLTHEEVSEMLEEVTTDENGMVELEKLVQMLSYE